jgi:hypothetical protein
MSVPRFAKRPHWTWILLLLLIALLAWLWQRQEAPRWTQELTERERAALYERTLQNLKSVCHEPVEPARVGFCREQATLIRTLPECDADCQTLAQHFAPSPTR